MGLFELCHETVLTFLSFNHCNINIPVSNGVFSYTFSNPEICLNGSLVMNIRCVLEILLAWHEYINQKSDPPFHLQQ